MKNLNKARIIYVLEILRKYSDFDHKINCSQIIEKLKEKGFTCDRKTVYSDLEALIECGYDINKSDSKKEGFYLDEREFQDAELMLLVNAVKSARFITEKKTDDIISKLLNNLSIFKANEFQKTIEYKSKNKSENEEILYNYDIINYAIANNKKITFMYYHKIIKNDKIINNAGKSFEISPYSLFWNDDKCYLVGNYSKYDDLSNYRLDRMKKVSVKEEERRPITEVSEYIDSIDIDDYKIKHPEIYAGNTVNITLKIPVDLAEIFFEKFGEQSIHPYNEKNYFLLRTNVTMSDGFINWLLPYCDRVKVITPVSLKNKLYDRINNIYSSFE